MATRFYVVFAGNGKQQVIECRMDEIDRRLSELGAILQGEGDSREEALTQVERANPPGGWYSGLGSLPMPK
jgi:hypothetical protein